MYIFFCITYKTFFVSTEIAFSSKALAVQTKGAVDLKDTVPLQVQHCN